jgi:hypothetical protein
MKHDLNISFNANVGLLENMKHIKVVLNKVKMLKILGYERL